ncbi:MAG: P-loop NTPase fold protein [Bacteroidota bacterium]
MKSNHNPFILKGYQGNKLFCDRDNETKIIISNAENNISTTLLSLRRIGKTGLIQHVFHKMKSLKEWECIYIDVYATQNISEFTNQLASAVFKTFPQNHSIGKKFMKMLKNFSPVLKFDALTGIPEISFSYTDKKQYEFSLKNIFEFLDAQNKSILIAFDEFQQVALYPEKNTEALLRTIIQTLKNVNFIFSGSNKHLLTEMFNSIKRPFFSSTFPVFLEPIAKNKYASFIQHLFTVNNKTIDDESVSFIMEWTRLHTYYTQALCNKVYLQNQKKVTIENVYYACDTILKEQENIYFQYRNLLTSSQWKLLTAIAKEDKVYQPTAYSFSNKHLLGNSASVRRSLLSLEKKEMVVQIVEKETSYYRVYDCFLSRWLQR